MEAGRTKAMSNGADNTKKVVKGDGLVGCPSRRMGDVGHASNPVAGGALHSQSETTCSEIRQTCQSC